MGANKDLLIYVVEDNKMYNKIVTEYLVREGFKKVKSFLSGKECLRAVKGGESPDIVIQDYHLQDSTGIDVLVNVKKHSKNSEFIFLTANEDMEVAVNSIKYGAFDYIIKDNDLSLKKVLNKIDKISKMILLQRRNKVIKTAMIATLCVLIGIVIFTALHTFFDAFGLQR
ncbi:response regulator [Prolixibacteraceae bacterium Z1-6]|uniref:Response regulator n=1 Tax=Draconibacterium aestuarii TaxID=2998507 RepID=A0A9X3F386_9BACT|nr:response regulator [Prolixibacteraceae bacterium Z1-6]